MEIKYQGLDLLIHFHKKMHTGLEKVKHQLVIQESELIEKSIQLDEDCNIELLMLQNDINDTVLEFLTKAINDYYEIIGDSETEETE